MGAPIVPRPLGDCDRRLRHGIAGDIAAKNLYSPHPAGADWFVGAGVTNDRSEW